VVGIVEVVREAYPDPTAEAGPWLSVDVRTVGPLPRPVTLSAIRADPALADMALIRLSRLSVSPVSEAHWQHVLRMAEWEG
jgi:predicted RNA-binding protein with PUA-like domain